MSELLHEKVDHHETLKAKDVYFDYEEDVYAKPKNFAQLGGLAMNYLTVV